MSGFLEMMAAPVVIALILVAMHGYLGSHVVRRGVIFVDIALAQVAAFGVAVALFFGGEVGTDQAFAVGLGSTFLGALLLSRTRTREARIPQEAYIGIVYAVFSAAMILILTQVPHGGEEIRHLHWDAAADKLLPVYESLIAGGKSCRPFVSTSKFTSRSA